MDWIRHVVAFCLALVAMPALLAAGEPQGNRGGGQQPRQSGTYQEYDRVTDATFTVSTDTDGNAHFTIRGGEFLFEKVLGPAGDATIRLTQGKDVVTIAVSQGGYHVERGRKSVRLNPRSSQGGGPDPVRSLLAGSAAVRTFKRLTAALEERDESEEDGALALSALIDGAMLQMIDGEPGAARRVGKRVTRKQRTAIRPVKASAAPQGYRDCVGLYEISLLWGWDQFASCYVEAQGYSWWVRDWVEYACEFEWVLRSQQYLWQFVGCITLPI
jgi:hypothetical protein